jgi:hypothetical protein
MKSCARPAVPEAAYGSLPFAEQIAFFRRKLDLPTGAWTDIWQAEHDHAFVVAGANRLDLVADFRAAIDKAIANGTTLAEFRKDFDTLVKKYGWSYKGGRDWRSRVIYDTNLRSSYAAGRFAQLQSIKAVRPYWQYVHCDYVLHPRPRHQAWNGLILHADDPWWLTHFPPNGWGCQCTVRALSKRDLDRLGKDGPDQAPAIDMQQVTVGTKGENPRLIETPAGIDPGWGYAPGRDAFERLVQAALDKTAQLPAEQAAEAAGELLALPRAQAALEQGFANFLDGVDLARPANAIYTVGALDADIVAALRAKGLEPATAAIVARDVEIAHALRDAKQAAETATGRPKALTREELAQLPEMLGDPQAVLLEPKENVLIYVFPAARREAGKILVRVNYRLKTDAGRVVTNAFRTASLIDYADIAKEVNGGGLILLKGKL